MHKTEETAYDSVTCHRPETSAEARAMASAQLATAGGWRGGRWTSPRHLAKPFLLAPEGESRESQSPPHAQPPNNSLG